MQNWKLWPVAGCDCSCCCACRRATLGNVIMKCDRFNIMHYSFMILLLPGPGRREEGKENGRRRTQLLGKSVFCFVSQTLRPSVGVAFTLKIAYLLKHTSRYMCAVIVCLKKKKTLNKSTFKPLMCDYSHFKHVFNVCFKPNWQQNFSTLAVMWKRMIIDEPTHGAKGS